MKKERDVIRPQTPSAEKIKCRDCIYRDKATVDVGDKILPVGVTRYWCTMYPQPPKGNGKPRKILFDNADCPHHKKG